MTTQNSQPSASNVLAQALKHTERTRVQALVDRDILLARQLHAPDFQLITPVGAVLSKEHYLNAIASGHLQYVQWVPGDMDVRLYGTAAVIRYQARLEVVFGGHRVPAGQYWHTDTYEKIGDQWQAVWSQATEIKS